MLVVMELCQSFFYMCVSTNVCKYIIMNLIIMYLLTFVKVSLLRVQPNPKYLVELQCSALKGTIRFSFQILFSICYKCLEFFLNIILHSSLMLHTKVIVREKHFTKNSNPSVCI
jgi:uncharacterized membrane protein YcgQ (UPF0703/DUF1980 family)